MAATTFGTAGATYGLTQETGGLIQSVNDTQSTEKAETRNHAGEVARVTYYNPTTSVDAEWVPTGGTGISAAALATAITIANTPAGSGLVIVEEITNTRDNTSDNRRSFRAMRYPLITS
jgi:hypothetical protein